MSKVNLRIRGPITRRTWNHYRRRFVSSSKAGLAPLLFASGAAFIISTLEPNLSGVWIDQNGTRYQLTHIGENVTAVSAHSGSTKFTAGFTEPSKMEGHINVRWRSKAMREKCGHNPVRAPFEAHVKRGKYEIDYVWENTWAYEKDCLKISTSFEEGKLRKISNWNWETRP